MKKSIFLAGLGMAIAFIGGCAVAEKAGDQAEEQPVTEDTATRPAYMIISINEIRPDKLDAFKAAVGPIVEEKAGGAEMLAVAQERDINVLEGEWDKPGLLIIERFKSMEALEAYWYSDEYAEVKKLREGHAEANFFVAIEGQPLPSE